MQGRIYFILLLFICNSSLLMGEDGEIRDFTDTQGRVIKAEVLLVLYIADREIAEYKSGEKSIKNAVWGKNIGYDPIADLKHVKDFSRSSR